MLESLVGCLHLMKSKIPPRLVVSYPRQHLSFVESLGGALHAKTGAVVWHDQRTGIGEDWWSAICEQIEQADAIIAVIGKEWAASPFCQVEIDYATSLGKPILPIVRKGGKIPASLKGIHAVSERSVEGARDAIWTRLLELSDRPPAISRTVPRPLCPRSVSQRPPSPRRAWPVWPAWLIGSGALVGTLGYFLPTFFADDSTTGRKPGPAPAPPSSTRAPSPVTVESRPPEQDAGNLDAGNLDASADAAVEAVVPALPRVSCPDRMQLIPPSNPGPSSHSAAGPKQLPAFCMDRTEVSVAEYIACVQAKACTPTAAIGAANVRGTEAPPLCRGENVQDANHPVNCVTWKQAFTFCKSAGKRLPTEQEWERGARGDDGRTYPWGEADPFSKAGLVNACDRRCWDLKTRLGDAPEPSPPSLNDGFEYTAPVGSFPLGASATGLLDMAGNVAEWTDSPYCDAMGQTCTSTSRVYRGGSWQTRGSSGNLRAATRLGQPMTGAVAWLGFRCAGDVVRDGR